MTRSVGMCVAVESSGGFGIQGTIPWDLPEDFQHFKNTVRDGICISGRTTFMDMYDMSIKNDTGKLYKNCLINTTPHIIVSTSIRENADLKFINMIDDCRVEHYLVNSVEAALKLSADLHPELDVWFIGGRSIFDQGLDYCDRVLTTIIPASYTCDVWFPTKKLQRMYTPRHYKDLPSELIPNMKVLEWIRN